VLAPGEELDVDLGAYSPVLRDSGGSLSVSSFRGVVVGCDSWGSGSC
jgi:hypothetical protein